MAASGYTPISLYYSTTASAAPSAGNLVNGELAINITDGKLYYKDNAGVVQTLVNKNGIVPVSLGGTGLSSTPTNGQLLIGNGTGYTLATLTQGTGVSITSGSGAITISATGTGGTVTSVSGTGTVNGITLTGTVTSSGSLTLGGTLSGVSLTTQVSGTLPVGNGGTGATTLAANSVLLGNATSAIQTVAPGTSGNVLTSDGTTWSSQPNTAAGDAIGTIKMFAGATTTSYPGSSYLLCDGSVVSQSTYASLYAKLGLNANTVTQTSPDTYIYPIQTRSGSQTCNAVVYNGSQFIGAGVSGSVYTSTDVIHWTSSSSMSGVFNGTIYGGITTALGTTFFGDGGSLVTTTDGTNWSLALLPNTSSYISSFVYGSSETQKYVAVINSGTCFSSTNMTNWVARVNGNSLNGGIVHNGTTYVGGGSSGIIRSSTDGINWTARTSNTTSNIVSMLYASAATNKYVYSTEGGGIGTSTDFINWTARTSGTALTITGLTYADNKFYASVPTQYYVLTSTDAITWTSVSLARTGPGLNYGSTIIYNSANSTLGFFRSAGTYYDNIATGYCWGSTSLNNMLGGDLYGATEIQNKVYIFGLTGTLGTTTNNGASWTGLVSNTTQDIAKVIYASPLTEKYLYAGYSGAIGTSTDGVTWVSRTSGATVLYDVIYGDKYVAMGVVGGVNGSLSSTDGISWSTSTSGILNYGMRQVAYAPGKTVKYVATSGANLVLTSTNAVSWTSNTLSALSGNSLYSIAYGSNVYTACGDNGYIYYSNDGINWTKGQNIGTPIYSIQYNNGVFTGSTGSGVYYSYDGKLWTLASWIPYNASTVVGGMSNSINSAAYQTCSQRVARFNKFTYNTATEFTLPNQVAYNTAPAVDTYYIKAT